MNCRKFWTPVLLSTGTFWYFSLYT